jgi:electron transport complex protein RnfG
MSTRRLDPAHPAVRSMLRGAVLLGLFAVLGTGLVAAIHQATQTRIAANQREALLRSLHALIDPASHDNDLLQDILWVESKELLGSNAPIPVYRARRAGRTVALALSPYAPDGYSGPIRLLIAVDAQGTLLGVRVLSHKETPGLGDKIDVEKSDWVLGFTGRSLDNPIGDRWAVRRDGGVFDQFTGATITPRAVVRAVHRALQYVKQQHRRLFAPEPLPPAPKEASEHE